MATCTYCEQEMLVAASCSVTEPHVDGVAQPLPRWGAETGYGRLPRPLGRCGDCGVEPGGAHHPGCDLAQCPRCRGQLLSCGCRFDEDPPGEDYGDGEDDYRGGLDDTWVA